MRGNDSDPGGTYTVIQNEYYTPRLRVFRFDHLRHPPKEKRTQMVYHFKALI